MGNTKTKTQEEHKMKKLNVYDVYLDDGRDVFKCTIPAENKAAAKRYVTGNGEVVAIKDCALQDIDTNCLADTLRRNGWGQTEIDVIIRTLHACGLERH